jgi:transposase
VITGVARRRRFSTELKLAVVSETMQPGMSVSYVARRHGLSPSWCSAGGSWTAPKTGGISG